ncbi:MAG: hypothetical protein HUN04_13955 [Desulfobacter sp.]|nr:MAG: hypothetical protein HUN04_13955 [Desulfobacter sp.]
MKQIAAGIFILLFFTHIHASELSDTFSDKYQALFPPDNSSVHSDYLFEQISLGSRYTVLMLERLNNTNSEVSQKTDEVIEKLDILIEQNKTIIELLKKEQTK